ncbi:hypothetical protein P7C70_g3123, partial [Phenoliferia sp. Uapishka_3]
MKRPADDDFDTRSTEEIRPNSPRMGSGSPLTPVSMTSPPWDGEQLRVLIVGCGFAGLSAAIACARQGFSVRVLDRAKEPSLHGDSIVLGANAAKLLFRWGLGPEFLEKSSKGEWALCYDDFGLLVRKEDMRDSEVLYGAPRLQGHRAQFLEILRKEAERLGVEIQYDTEVVEYWDVPTCPAVVTKAEDIIEADVVLICVRDFHFERKGDMQAVADGDTLQDGVKSNGRELLEGSFLASQLTRMSEGYSVWRGVTKSDAFLKDDELSSFLDGNSRFWFGDDAHFTLSPLDNGRQVSFTFTHRDPKRRATTNTQDRRAIGEVLSLLEGWDPRLIRAVSLFKTAINWRVTEDEAAGDWVTSGGKIACLGDSVHPLLPTSYQGGSQSIEDGATLAIVLALVDGRDHSDIRLALRTYEQLRRNRVDMAQTLGVEQRRAWHSFSKTHNPATLSFLGAELLEHDAERHAVIAFETTAQRLNDEFSLAPGRKHEVLTRLNIV